MWFSRAKLRLTRCFLFDDEASFIEGYYIVGLLAEAFLQKQPGAKIIHDPRLTWNTVDIVTRSGGQPVMSKTGHAFIKERMRQEDAIYGGEMSAHHYFRDFAYCDSGMIPWLLVAELLCLKNSSLKSLVADRQAAFPASGEINRKLGNAAEAIARLKHHLHVAPQIALKAGARHNGLAEQIHAAAPFALQSGQHAQNRRFAAARGADQAEGFPASTRKLAAETAVFAPNVTCKS